MSNSASSDDDDATPRPQASLVDAMFSGEPAEAGDKDAGTLLAGLPYAKEIGIRLLSAENGEATLSIPYDERLIGDPDTGVISGGVVTSLLDTCGGVAVMASPTKPGSVATLDLRIDYMRPAKPGATVFAHARCFRETTLITFVTAVAYQSSPDEPIATAIGAFRVDGRAKPKTPAKIDAAKTDAAS